MKSKFFYFYVPLICVHLVFGIATGSAVDSYRSAEIPIFNEGYKVEKTFDPYKKALTVSYHVQALHPAAEVLEFYDAYFNGKGWISSFETCQRNWMDIGGRTNANEPAARVLFASWEHAGSNRKVLLWIRHRPPTGEREDEVVVEYRVQPIAQK